MHSLNVGKWNVIVIKKLVSLTILRLQHESIIYDAPNGSILPELICRVVSAG
jgi:hypothetical protein